MVATVGIVSSISFLKSLACHFIILELVKIGNRRLLINVALTRIAGATKPGTATKKVAQGRTAQRQEVKEQTYTIRLSNLQISLFGKLTIFGIQILELRVLPSARPEADFTRKNQLKLQPAKNWN